MPIKPRAEYTITATDKTKKALQSARKRLDGLKHSLKPVTVGFGAAAVAAGALVKSSLATNDVLAKTSDKLGIATEKLAGLEHAAKITGVETNTLHKGLQNMVRNIADFGQGIGEAKRELESLGFSQQQLMAMSPDQQFVAIAEALKGVENNTERVNIAYKIFGGRATALLNTLDLGADGLAAMEAETVKFGTAITRVDAAKIEQANDAMTRAQAAIRGAATRATVELAPGIKAVADVFADAIAGSDGFSNTVVTGLRVVVKGVGYAWNAIRGLHLLWDTGRTMFLEFKSAVLDGMVAIVEQFNRAAEALPFIDPKPLDDLRVSAINAAVAAADAKLELTLLANEPLPSEKVDAFFENVKVRAEEAAQAVAAARTGSAGAGDDTGTGGVSEDKIEKLRNSLLTEELQIQESFLRRAEMINQADLKEPRRLALLEALNAQHQQKLTAIAVKGYTDRQKFAALSTKAQAKQVLGELTSLTAGVAQQNKTMFRINQISGIANAIISTHEGITKALSAYPPPLSFVMAAAQAAAGFAQVNAIRSATFQGGGGGTTPSLAGSVPTVNGNPVQPIPQIDSTRQAGGGGTTEVILIGSQGFDADQVEGLVDQLNDAYRDGKEVRVSRQPI